MRVGSLIKQSSRKPQIRFGLQMQGVEAGVLTACEIRKLFKHLVKFKSFCVFIE